MSARSTKSKRMSIGNEMGRDVEDVYSDMYSTFSQLTSTTLNDIDQRKYPITFKTGLIYAGATIGGLLFGYDTGVISGVLVSLKPSDINLEILTNFQRELITSITSVGSIFGSILAFPLADRYGRRMTLAICTCFFIAAALLMSLSVSLSMLVGGRFVVGFGVGIAAQCIPIYLSEVSPSSLRGTMITLNSMAITGGQLLAYIISYGISSRPHAWRYLFAISATPALIFICLLDFIPESPRWLITAQRIPESRDALRMIYPQATEQEIFNKLGKMIRDLTKLRTYQDETEPLLSRSNSIFKIPSLTSLQNYVYSRESPSPQPYRPIRPVTKTQHKMEPRTRRALIIGCVLMFFQQSSGFNAFMYYSAVIFSRAGVDNPLLPAIIVALTNFLFTGVAMRFVDSFGRRSMLLSTIWIMTVGLLFCSIGFENNNFVLLLISVIIYVGAYASAMGTVPWSSVEFLPLNRRSFGGSCISCTNWVTNTFISMTYLSLMDKLGNETTMLIFAGVTVLNWLFVYFWYPEVKGLSLEEIGQVFENGVDVYYIYRNYHS